MQVHTHSIVFYSEINMFLGNLVRKYDFTFHSPWSPQQPPTIRTVSLNSYTVQPILLHINDDYEMMVHILVKQTPDSNKSFDFLLNPFCIIVVVLLLYILVIYYTYKIRFKPRNFCCSSNGNVKNPEYRARYGNFGNSGETM